MNQVKNVVYIDELSLILKFNFYIFKMFFGAIRKYGGNNRRPDCEQFQAALRKVLADKNILHSKKENCTALYPVYAYCPYSNIGTISSRSKKLSIATIETYTEDDIEEVSNGLNEIFARCPNRSGSNIADLSDISIAYIASMIELKIMNDKNYECNLCKNVFAQNEKLHQAFTSESHSSTACKSTFEICRSADYFLKLDMLKGQYGFELIFQFIMLSLNVDCLYEYTEFEEHAHEKISLVKQILHR